MPIAWPLAVAAGGLVALDRLALATARPPKRGLDRDPSELDVSHETIAFPAFDGITLRGEWLEPPGVADDRPVVVLVHGWTGNSGTMLYVAEPIVGQGYPAFAFDVRRHGQSDDAPYVTIRHFRDDLIHAVRVARRRRPDAPIVIAGHSLGGSAAILAAAEGAPVDGVAVIAAPADLFEVTAGMFSDRGLPGMAITRLLKPFWQRRAGVAFEELDPERVAAALPVPLLVAHGDLDARVPAAHARRLAAGANVDVTWIEGAEHKDILTRPELHDALGRFVARVSASRDGETAEVLAAVIRDGDRFLIGRRPAGKRHAGLWEFPGGKIRPDESMAEAASRELREELGLELIETGTTLFMHRDPGTPFRIHFVAARASGTPRLQEHDEIRWVHVNDLETLHFAPADRAFADWIVSVEDGERPGG